MSELEQIPKLMDIYRQSEAWDWRFGETPDFSNSLEKKFDWALVDMQFNVERGVITTGRCFSDCLVPPYIDAINEVISSGTITYDTQGMKNLGEKLRERFRGEASVDPRYTDELE